MQADDSELLAESVPESLKNILLVNLIFISCLQEKLKFIIY